MVLGQGEGMDEEQLGAPLSVLPMDVMEQIVELAQAHDPRLLAVVIVHGHPDPGLAVASWSADGLTPADATNLVIHGLTSPERGA